jgi:hypothetical protein
MKRSKLRGEVLYILGTIFLLLVACELTNPAPTPATATLTPITVPTRLPTLTPTASMPLQPGGAAIPSPTPALSATAPEALNCVDELVPPQLVETEPTQITPGTELRVMGTGGYLLNSCGGFNESARNFPLYLDDQRVGELGCYINYCGGRFTLPGKTQPGAHCISTEVGRCELEIQVTGN